MNEVKDFFIQRNNDNQIILKEKVDKEIFKISENNAFKSKILSNPLCINNFRGISFRNMTANENKLIKLNNNLNIKISHKPYETKNFFLSKIFKNNLTENIQNLFVNREKELLKKKNKIINRNEQRLLDRNINLKKINSSNDIFIENQSKDYFTKKLFEGSNSNCNLLNNSNNDINNIQSSEYKENKLNELTKFGLFNIDFKPNFDIEKNKNNSKDNKNIINFTSNINNNRKESEILPKNIINFKNRYKHLFSINIKKIKKNSSNDFQKRDSNENKLITKKPIILESIDKKMSKNKSNIYYFESKALNNYTPIIKKSKLLFNNENNKRIIYQYLILKGNASYLIKNCMYHRINWVEVSESEKFKLNIFNFKWKQTSHKIDYYNLGKRMKQMVNHFEHHSIITNKAKMFISLMNYCEKMNLSVFKYVPFTIIFKIKDKRKIKDSEKQKKWNKKLEKLKNFIQNIEKNVIAYDEIGKYVKDKEYIELIKSRKEAEKMKQENKEKIKSTENDIYKGKYEIYSDIFPRPKFSEKLNKELDKNSLSIGKKTLIEIPQTHFKSNNMWVLKAINLNRGKCIKVVNSFQQMEKVINKFKSGVDPSNFTLEEIDPEGKNELHNIEEEKKDNLDTKENNDIENNKEIKVEEKDLYNCTRIIIQKYIENPLLYRGRKCDMRVWVLLSHKMQVFLFKEGHLKTCSIEYDVNSKDAFSHITNYSFQKYNSNFQKFEKGNEVPFYEFQKFIDEKYPEKKYDIKKELIPKLKDIISITMRSAKNKINKNNRNFQFEIFGYDFMLDTDFNLFLIEINTNPGLEISSPWIKVIVPRMLDDALRLTIDKVFHSVYDFTKIYKEDKIDEPTSKENIGETSNKNIIQNLNDGKKIEDEEKNNENNK